MGYYICNKQVDNNGRHEVHIITCSHLPVKDNQLEIGWKNSCQEAIQQMYEWNPTGFKFDGCYWCCRPCHRG